MTHVAMGILPTSSMASLASGMRFLGLTLDVAGGALSPELYGEHEPLRSKFDPRNLERALESWGWGFFWRRTVPRLNGSVFVETGSSHDGVFLGMPVHQCDLEVVLEFIRNFQEVFGVELAYLHVAPDEELEDLDRYRKRQMPFGKGLHTRRLRVGLPDLPWGSVFGTNYRALIGERLLSAPAHRVEEMGEAVYVQLTEKMTDPFEHYSAYAQVREMVKAHLGPDLFVEGPGGPRIPRFWFEAGAARSKRATEP